MMRRLAAVVAIAAAAFFGRAPDARAGGIVYSTLGFSDNGVPSADTGDITTATTLTIGSLHSTPTGTNGFSGFVPEDFGQKSFSTTTGPNASLTFGDGPSGLFGTFTSTDLSIASKTATSITFYVLGNYVPGTYAPNLSGAASMTISFTQTDGGAISDSSTFSVPPAPTPEPAGLVMGLTSIALSGLILLRRRRRRVASV